MGDYSLCDWYRSRKKNENHLSGNLEGRIVRVLFVAMLEFLAQEPADCRRAMPGYSHDLGGRVQP